MLSAKTIVRPAILRIRIGNREIVGPSLTGVEEYYDRVEWPCPAIRYREPSQEIEALQTKEKGSWKALTIDEKKKLYRHSFRQTLTEVEAPTYENRRIFGGFLFLLSIPIFIFTLMKATVFPPLPESLSDQNKKQMVRWYIDTRTDFMDGGISSKWDYEKNQWKEKPYWFMKSK